MDEFAFEELIANMLDITDEQREEDTFLEDAFYKKFGIDFYTAFEFVKQLILHTTQIESPPSKQAYHAFISKKAPVMLIKLKVK